MKIAFPTDQHCPFQDDRAIEVAQKVVRDFDPDLLVVGSDGIDFYAISHFDKNPKHFSGGLQGEIDTWTRVQLAWRDAAPNARRMFIPGNHEDRLRKYLWQHPELHSLKVLEIPTLLDLDAMSIEVAEEDEIVVNDLLVVKHGAFIRQHSGMSAKAELEGEKHAISTLTGHTHRGGMHHVTTRQGVVTSVEGYCLCRLDPEYIAHPNWQQGIVLATVSDEVVFEPVLIHGSNWAIWRGKEYTS